MAKPIPDRSNKAQVGKRRRARTHGERVSEDHQEITEREVEDIEERSSPRTPVIYEIVCRLGEEEMVRPAFSLWWSGVAAGLSISFSLLAQAILHIHLPDAPWRPLVADARLFGRLRHGGHVAPAAVHREHDDRGFAGHG